MISTNLENAINEQITAELWSSNLYLSMSFALRKEGWEGFAHWMEKQSLEEREHAIAFADFLIKRGGEAKLSIINSLPEGWASLLEIFESAYTHERHVSALIDNLLDMAEEEDDKAVQDFLWGFVREQVEEEASTSAIVDKIKKAEYQGLMFIDAELSRR